MTRTITPEIDFGRYLSQPPGSGTETITEDLETRLSQALSLPAEQQPMWPDAEDADATNEILRNSPPITQTHEVERLKDLLSAVERGEAFLLQGGDCAETFSGNTEQHIRANTFLLKQLGLALSYGARKPVVKVGRIAGQYAKPRSSDVDGTGNLSYRGDIVNSATPTAAARLPDPRRMIEAYRQSTTTMNVLRALTGTGGPDLHEVHRWTEDWLRGSRASERFTGLTDAIGRSLQFMAANGGAAESLAGTEIFTSHEALLLDYERAMLRRYGEGGSGRLYDLSAHFLWVGERTRQRNGAHIALAELLENPIGVKIGPHATPDEVADYVERLDPSNTPGRLTLITRMGADRIRDVLPPIVERVVGTGRSVIWQCDPMHGNTHTARSGHKTRDFDRIVDETQGFFEVHRASGTIPGGMHLEMTGDEVTECIGGSQEITDPDLANRYESACDPRLNRQQALELGLLITEMLTS